MGKVKPSNALARKELRKAHRQAAKEKKQQRHAKRAVQKTTVDTTDEKPKIIASTAAGARSASFDTKKRKQDGFKMGGGEKGGGSGGRRRKRWRPEEIDPMIAAEDAEIKRLERLLGIAGSNAKKKRAKLDRELEQEDGLGDEFGAFLAGLDHIGEAVEGNASGSSNDVDADWDFHENVVGSSSSGSSGEGGERDESSACGAGKRQLGRGEANIEGVLDSDSDRDEDDNEDDNEEAREEEEAHEGREGREGGGNNGMIIGRDGAHAAQHRLNDAEDESMKERDEISEPEDGEKGKVNEEREDALEEEDEDEEYDEEEEEDYDDEESEDFDDDEKNKNGDKESIYEDEEGDVVGVGRQEKIERKKGCKVEGRDGAGENRTKSCDKEDDDGEGDEEREEGEDFRLHAYRPTPGQDIYGRLVGKGDVGPAPAKYVPPHLRVAAAAAGEAETGKRQEVQRKVNGIMNRLSEDTLEPVAARLKDAYRAYSTTVVNEALWQATRAVCVHPKQVMSTLIPPFAAVIAALNISLGADVGGFFLETIARELNAEVWGATGTGSRGTCLNLALLLAYLYNYGVAHCSLIYDIIRLLVQAFGPTEMELLLILLQHSGYQLRSDDPQALQQIVAIVKDRSFAVATVTASAASTSSCPSVDLDNNTKYLAEDAGRWKAAFGSGASSSDPASVQLVGQASGYEISVAPGSNPAVAGTSRSRYILDTIVELQGNKRSRIREQGQEYGRRLRKWLGSVKAAKTAGGRSGGTGGDTSLRVSWAELVSTESRGRWWKVGAAWAGRGSTSGNGAGQEKTDMVADSGDGGDVTVRASDAADDEEGVGLLTLAARQRMNTDVRRSVFVAIMGSLDCEDALEKILRLNLKGAQEREIARVIIECCSQERSYNPFYAHLAERVCDRQPKLRFTFQVTFWDALKTLDERAARRAGSLARLMAHLVLQKQLSLTILKTVEVPELTASGLLLVRIFFQEIIAAGDDAAFMEVFRRLARPPGEKGAVMQPLETTP